MRLKRLAEIVKHLNNVCGVELGHFIKLEGKSTWSFRHKDFGWGWRVRTAVKVLGAVVILVLAGGLLHAYSTGQWWKAKEREKIQAEVEVKAPVQVEFKGQLPLPAPPKAPSNSK